MFMLNNELKTMDSHKFFTDETLKNVKNLRYVISTDKIQNGTIIINPKAIIGNNCNITSGVTIGQTNRGLLKGVPIIGDQVWIGSNCTIVGGIIIGNNVLIAPNSYVNINVPSNSIVIGNPAQVIPRLNAVESYIEFILINQ